MEIVEQRNGAVTVLKPTGALIRDDADHGLRRFRDAGRNVADCLEKNRFGQVPVIEDGEATLSDSNAILVYLASKLACWPSTGSKLTDKDPYLIVIYEFIYLARVLHINRSNGFFSRFFSHCNPNRFFCV